MPLVQAFATVHRSAESMWREVGSFQGVARWHPMLVSSPDEGDQPGSTRTIQTRDGHRMVEQLTQVDSDEHLYRYEVTETALPIADYKGEFRIREDGPAKCTVVWTARFTVTSGDEKRVTDAVREFLCAGARSIEKRFTGRPVTASPHDLSTLRHRR